MITDFVPVTEEDVAPRSASTSHSGIGACAVVWSWLLGSFFVRVSLLNGPGIMYCLGAAKLSRQRQFQSKPLSPSQKTLARAKVIGNIHNPSIRDKLKHAQRDSVAREGLCAGPPIFCAAASLSCQLVFIAGCMDSISARCLCNFFVTDFMPTATIKRTRIHRSPLGIVAVLGLCFMRCLEFAIARCERTRPRACWAP